MSEQGVAIPPAVPGVAGHPIRAITFECPHRKRRVTELWAGLEPVVAANLYLASDSAWEDSTVDTKARHLVPFFQWLAEQRWDFWDYEVRGGGALMATFRNQLVDRSRPDAADAERITARYARSIMLDVFLLCVHWKQAGEPALSNVEGTGGQKPASGQKVTEGSGAHVHRTSVEQPMPGAFKVSIPAEEAAGTPDVLLVEDIERIWAHVGAKRQPKSPDLLRHHPLRPRPEWSATRRAEWARTHGVFARKLAWHRRRQMLWALMYASGMRRQELPLLIDRDVRLYQNQLWVRLRVRREHRHLGHAKTGGRLMYVGFDRRVLDAWESWAQSRAVLVARWTARTGKPDHGMFLVNYDGGPLTVEGIQAFCDGINKAFTKGKPKGYKPFGDEGFGEGAFLLHPHACRHAIAAMFDEWEIDVKVKQRHLGHRRMQTTERYGKTFRGRYVAQLAAFEQRVTAATQEAVE